MDQLETQVSDLRSFLGPAAAPQGPEVVQVVSPHDVAYPDGPLRARHHSSSVSAPGDNSAPHHHHHHHHRHSQHHGHGHHLAQHHGAGQQQHGHHVASHAQSQTQSQTQTQQQQQQNQQQQTGLHQVSPPPPPHHRHHQIHQQPHHHSLLNHHSQSIPPPGDAQQQHQQQQPSAGPTSIGLGAGHGGNASAVTSISAVTSGPGSVAGSTTSSSTVTGVVNSAAAASTTSGAGSAKRRADESDEGPVKQQRSKRNRYISIACNECKRRKIKCNGQTPCQRCGHLNLQCIYAPNCCSNFKDSEEFRQMAEQVQRLQEQVDSLVSSMNSLRQETARLAPLQDRVLPPPAISVPVSSSSTSLTLTHQPPPRPSLPLRGPSFFNGPTSLSFTVDVAKNTLHNMGYAAAPDNNGDGPDEPGAPRDPSPNPSPVLAPLRPNPPPPAPADPIWEYDEAEMLRLLQIYKEEIDAMYPVATIEKIVEHIRWLSNWMETTRRTGVPPAPGLDAVILDRKTMLLKIVMCCALVVAEHGHSAKAVRLYDSMQPIIDKMLMSSPADVTWLSFLGLCAGYRFLSNDEVLAWRTVGQVARLCLELGLHRREGLERITDPQTRRDALHTFWSAYVLDRRWSFSTGLPFVCHDDKIDPKLPYPEGHPFLEAMIGYSRVAAKIWQLVDYFEPAVIRELKPTDFEERDREILEWYETVPAAVRADPSGGDKFHLPSGPHDIQRLRIWTWLRLTQVRIWLYTPVLHSATSIAENKSLAHKVVEMSRQTIRLLTRLNNETDLYRRMQVFYHQFLTSSIAVLFLASTHAPVQFSALCRDEFYKGLDLIKEMSARSWVSHRLWRTIRSLRAYAPKVGLATDGGNDTGSGSDQSAGGGGGGMPSSSNAQYRSGAGQVGGQAGSNGGAGGPTMPSPMSGVTPTGSSSGAGAGGSGGGGFSGIGGVWQPMQIDDANNGLRLQSEMSRIYEGYAGLAGGSDAGGVAGMTTTTTGAEMAGYGASAPVMGLGISGGGGGVPGQGPANVYQHMKDMF